MRVVATLVSRERPEDAPRSRPWPSEIKNTLWPRYFWAI